MNKHLKIVGMGELLWDLLPGGKQLGGAPANFAIHARQLGAEGLVVSSVGADPLGRQILEQLGSCGVPTDAITIHPTLPTGTVTVAVAEDGQPRFTIHENVAWDDIQPNPAALEAVRHADAVVFGSLAQRTAKSRQALRDLLALVPSKAVCVFDINLRQHYYSLETIEYGLRRANVLKINHEELAVLGAMLGTRGDEREQVSQLASRYDLKVVSLTRGASGSLLHAEGRFSEHPGFPARVVDTVGAGDAFTACLTLGLLHGWDLERINGRANEIAAYVCGCPGATPALPETMRGWFRGDD